MLASITIQLNTAKKTHSLGVSLAKKLVKTPVDILLSGPVGAGKTTFVQGLAEGLGIPDQLTSPTYALEQRYTTADDQEYIHIDLYRLEQEQISPLLAASDDHTGIRCIEWAEKLPEQPDNPTIIINLAEQNDGRVATITFNDIAIPPIEEIEQWRNDVQLPQNVIDHCKTVAHISAHLASYLCNNGTLVRTNALVAAAEAHDLLRFIDFSDKAAPEGVSHSDDQQQHWRALTDQFPHMDHETAVGAFLRQKGYPEIASIAEVHGPSSKDRRTSIEQELLFYADKRAVGDTIVSITDRYKDFAIRYGNGEMDDRSKQWLEDAKEVEERLFPDGIPPIPTQSI